MQRMSSDNRVALLIIRVCIFKLPRADKAGVMSAYRSIVKDHHHEIVPLSWNYDILYDMAQKINPGSIEAFWNLGIEAWDYWEQHGAGKYTAQEKIKTLRELARGLHY